MTDSEQPSWDAPNQQVVREDQSGPWQEGSGGEAAGDEPAASPAEPAAGDDLDAMTKDELLAYGQQLGLVPMNAGMTKEEIREAIDQHLGG